MSFWLLLPLRWRRTGGGVLVVLLRLSRPLYALRLSPSSLALPCCRKQRGMQQTAQFSVLPYIDRWPFTNLQDMTRKITLRNRVTFGEYVYQLDSGESASTSKGSRLFLL